MTKVALRERCLKQLKNSTKHNRRYKNHLLNQQLKSDKKVKRAGSVLGFWPLGMEPDIRELLNMLRRGKKLYLPFMEDDSFKMVPFRLPLEIKKFGIFEPGNSNRKIKKVDVAIVPTVGVDGEGRRIGFGKGMYDRFFARVRKKPYIIFIQSELCHTTKYICDDYDIKAERLITPHVAYSIVKGTNYGKRNTLRRWHRHA